MKITLKIENDYQDKPIEMQLSNEEYESYDYIELRIGEDAYSVPLDELSSALAAFDRYRTVFQKRETEKSYEMYLQTFP